MSTREYDAESIRSDLLAYLREPGFTYFQPSDVADYPGIGQIWVTTRHGICESNLVFDYRTAVLRIDARCDHEHDGPPPAEYSAEIAVVSAAFGDLCDLHATVVPVRNRPLIPGTPPHRTEPLPPPPPE